MTAPPAAPTPAPVAVRRSVSFMPAQALSMSEAARAMGMIAFIRVS
jgi:hypothetical protein